LALSCLIAFSAIAQAQPTIQYQDAVTQPNGSVITQPVIVTPSKPLPVTGTVTTSGGPATIANGADVVEGSQNDAAACPSGTAKTLAGCLAQLHADATAAIPAGTNVVGYVTNDPCGQATKLGASISLTASGQVIAGTSAKKTYICSYHLVSATAQNIALVEGTGTVCATNIFGLAGGTTAATGWNLAANGGIAEGSGAGTVVSPSADTNGTAANVCLLLSSTGQTSGHITYVQQ
jgi:hypothetical protein